MSKDAMKLKAKIKTYAKRNHITAQVVLQNYMFERFLERLSVSNYKDKFIVKGGMLISAIVGLDCRTTMDLDATLKDLPLNKDKITETMKSICMIDLKDGVEFKVTSANSIRKND